MNRWIALFLCLLLNTNSANTTQATLPGGEYAYEVLNLVDGRRTAQEIRDVVLAAYGPIPLDFVVEYLRTP